MYTCIKQMLNLKCSLIYWYICAIGHQTPWQYHCLIKEHTFGTEGFETFFSKLNEIISSEHNGTAGVSAMQIVSLE